MQRNRILKFEEKGLEQQQQQRQELMHFYRTVGVLKVCIARVEGEIQKLEGQASDKLARVRELLKAGGMPASANTTSIPTRVASSSHLFASASRAAPVVEVPRVSQSRNKMQARHLLRSQKRLIHTIHRRYTSLSNLELTLQSMEEVSANKNILECLKEGAVALKSALKANGTTDGSTVENDDDSDDITVEAEGVMMEVRKMMGWVGRMDSVLGADADIDGIDTHASMQADAEGTGSQHAYNTSTSRSKRTMKNGAGRKQKSELELEYEQLELELEEESKDQEKRAVDRERMDKSLQVSSMMPPPPPSSSSSSSTSSSSSSPSASASGEYTESEAMVLSTPCPSPPPLSSPPSSVSSASSSLSVSSSSQQRRQRRQEREVIVLE